MFVFIEEVQPTEGEPGRRTPRDLRSYRRGQEKRGEGEEGIREGTQGLGGNKERVCGAGRTYGFLQQLLQGVDSWAVSSFAIDNNAKAKEKHRRDKGDEGVFRCS